MAVPNPLDPDQMRREALLNQMGPPTMPAPVNTTQPVGAGTKLADPTTPAAAGPAATAAPPPAANYGTTSGYDPNKFGADPQSLKYLAGQMISRYGEPGRIGRSAIEQAMASDEWKNNPYLQNATYGGRDKIDFGGTPADLDRGGVGVFGSDVIRNFDENTGYGDALVWQDLVNTGGGGGTPGMVPGGGGGVDPTALAALNVGQQAGGGDALAQIMQQIQMLSEGEDPLQREALMELLGGRSGL